MAKKISSRKQQTDRYTCTITLPGVEASEYAAVLQGGRYKRSDITLKRSASAFIIEIRASDATALRASANSVLRDLQIFEASSGL